MNYGRQIAGVALDIESIKLSPDKPFTWASGNRMPIYNDNRMLLYDPKNRRLVTDAFWEIAKDLPFTVIAGTSTAGIPWGVSLANMFDAPFVYVRDKPKDHGLRNQIEGIDASEGLDGQHVLLLEDLISTGGSSVKAVQALRDAGGVCNNCLSIFNYGFDEAIRLFGSLNPPCNTYSLLDYATLLEVAREREDITPDQIRMLEEWRADPFNWGAKHGFPKVEK